jgi:hypothetical protein
MFFLDEWRYIERMFNQIRGVDVQRGRDRPAQAACDGYTAFAKIFQDQDYPMAEIIDGRDHRFPSVEMIGRRVLAHSAGR